LEGIKLFSPRGMKTITDTLKEIIKKDVSTQTDPVIVTPIKEGDMTKVVNFGERSETNLLLDKRRENFNQVNRQTQNAAILNENRKKILSGIDQVEKVIIQEEEKPTTVR
jgi:hypothetical protein